MVAERVFLSYKDKIDIICIRPATVCGLSERLRLDLTVNKLTFDAIYKKKIFVDGGSQIRPNIHIKDLISAIDCLIFTKKKLRHNIFNAGFENLKISEIANKIKKRTGAKIKINKNKDIRSYRQDSNKLLKTGFKRAYNVDQAIKDIISSYADGKFKDADNCYTVKWMRKLNFK